MTVHFPIVFMFSTHGVQPALPDHGREILRHHGVSLPGRGGFLQRGRDHHGLLHLVAELHGQAAEAGQNQDPAHPGHARSPRIVLFVWRLSVPDILDALSGSGLLYILLVLSLSAMVTVIGWNGASMTFPWKKNNRRAWPGIDLRQEGFSVG
ncbi:MAG: hypothetical protein MZV70_72035 [Desulfobacterales bacterium]|nr:hypothetical protein [Desulfobacterales bacterium]